MLGTIQVFPEDGNPWNNAISRALCDTGSQINLITRRAAKRLKLEITPIHIQLTGVQASKSQSNGFTYLTFIPYDQAFREKFYVVNTISPPLPTQHMNLHQHGGLSTLHLADPTYGTPGEIDALFGIGMWVKILREGTIKTKDDLIAAQRTVFGWVSLREKTNLRLAES